MSTVRRGPVSLVPQPLSSPGGLNSTVASVTLAPAVQPRHDRTSRWLSPPKQQTPSNGFETFRLGQRPFAWRVRGRASSRYELAEQRGAIRPARSPGRASFRLASADVRRLGTNSLSSVEQ